MVDIDGVVADVRHRLPLISGGGKDWDSFFAAAADDPPLSEGVALVLGLAQEHDVVWLTGRPERTRNLTAGWLGAQGLPSGEVLMRGDTDRRPARLTKRDALRTLAATRRIAVVVDDDPEVVGELRAEGFPVQHATWVPPASSLGHAQRRGRT